MRASFTWSSQCYGFIAVSVNFATKTEALGDNTLMAMDYRNQQGSSLIEFSVVLSIMILILGSMINLSSYLIHRSWVDRTMTQMARLGAMNPAASRDWFLKNARSVTIPLIDHNGLWRKRASDNPDGNNDVIANFNMQISYDAVNPAVQVNFDGTLPALWNWKEEPLKGSDSIPILNPEVGDAIELSKSSNLKVKSQTLYYDCCGRICRNPTSPCAQSCASCATDTDTFCKSSCS